MQQCVNCVGRIEVVDGGRKVLETHEFAKVAHARVVLKFWELGDLCIRDGGERQKKIGPRLVHIVNAESFLNT